MKIIGLSVVGVGEADRYLRHTLDEFKRLADDVVICLNAKEGEGKKEEELIKRYGFWFYRDSREWGKFQPVIKTDLLARIMKLKPDWVLPLDADETFTEQLDRKALEELTDGKIGCYFYIVNLWDGPEYYHKGLSFWNIRFFKPKPEMGLQYLKQPLHCGLAPPYAYKFGTYVPYLVKHYGLMKSEDRLIKVARYEKYDPDARYKSSFYYDALKAVTKPATYNEEALFGKIREEVGKMVHQKRRE